MTALRADAALEAADVDGEFDDFERECFKGDDEGCELWAWGNDGVPPEKRGQETGDADRIARLRADGEAAIERRRRMAGGPSHDAPTTRIAAQSAQSEELSDG